MPSTSERFQFWVNLTGKPADFPLNARIFHSVCLISIVALLYNVPFNYLIGLPDIALASLVVLLITCCMYYASRFKNRISQSIFVLNVMGLGLFITNFFLNSGHNGPTTLFFLLLLLLSISVSPTSQSKIWVPINILTVVGLHIFEYYYPQFVPNTYQGPDSQLIDGVSAYIVIALTSYFCMDCIRKSYEREKRSAFEKSKAIDEQNRRITAQNEELTRLNGEKNKLMSIVAHDLRAPLGSIQSFLELLTDYELDFAKRLEIERQLLHSTRDTLSMLTKLLEWSKSQIYGVIPRPEHVNLHAMLDTTMRIEENIAARKSITLDAMLDPGIDLFADPEMMQLIVRNLISNAIKFTPAGGSIVIRSKVRAIRGKAGEECVISIQDSGIGISSERQADIFSLHAQSTYGTKREKGVGLGLLLCEEFITAQNGKIWFESTPAGTCFFISVPAHSQEAVSVS